MPRYRTFLPRLSNANVTAQGDEQAREPSGREAALFDLIRTATGQQRKVCRLDKILWGVARARATDMATRGYLAHTDPDGFGPNYHVRQAGYKLPEWWMVWSPLDDSANYIESISSGNPTAQDVMISWLGSPKHREHVLGEGFYSDQVNIGAGYSFSKEYGSYWVLLSCPVET